MGCKLVWFPEENPRAVDPDYAPSGQHVSLADGYPMLIIGTATLQDLNNRLAHPVTMDRFRPNLIFSGGEPYQEDQFKEFRIGKNIFAGVKPCSRCNLITIDPETGEAGAEPLHTLSGYRKRNNKVYFGQNVIALHHDHLNEGDEIILS
ncbi:MAG: MOSC domain-containing protein [Bacteroidota bacterium]